jgi:hypothetical protein
MGVELTQELAKKIGDKLGIDWNKIPFDEFFKGIKVELEHKYTVDKPSPEDYTVRDWVVYAKISYDHLRERPDYYSKLDKMEKEPIEEISSNDLFSMIKPNSTVVVKGRFGVQRGKARIYNKHHNVWVLNLGGRHGTPGIATRDNIISVDRKKVTESNMKKMIREMRFPPKALDLNKLKNADSFWGWSIKEASRDAGLVQPGSPFKRIADMIFWLNMAAQEWERQNK